MQGHSSDCGLTAEQLLAEEAFTMNSLAGVAAEFGGTLGHHGTTVEALTSILATGLQPGGGADGAKYRLCNHFVFGDPPTHVDSTGAVSVDLVVLLESAVLGWRVAAGVLLTGPVPPNLIHSSMQLRLVACGSAERGLEVNPDTELELEDQQALC